MVSILKLSVLIALGSYVGLCLLLFLLQESLLFHPTQLPPDAKFSFSETFEEIYFPVAGDLKLHGLLFRSPEKKGVVLFLHGNAGDVSTWGLGASLFIDQGYDVLYLDYRGYGKSTGKIKGQDQLIQDAQTAYDWLTQNYHEHNILVSGTSIGTGMAVQMAAHNQPKGLILVSPYSSLKQLVREKIPILPGFILKYPFASYIYLHEVDCPIYIFHGLEDELIPPLHAQRLKEKSPGIHLHLVPHYGHNDISESPTYTQEMKAILREGK